MNNVSGSGLIKNLVLITTADFRGNRQAEIDRLFSSVRRFCISRPAVNVQHHLLLQRCEDAASAAIEISAPSWMSVTAVDRKISLSAARNLILDTVLSKPLRHDSIVAFPDDDAWYPDMVLEYVLQRFEADDKLDLWLCRYGIEARFDQESLELPPTVQQVVSYGSSNTLVMRGSLLDSIGGFDESLGLGTPAKSGEDTEFGLRAYLASRKSAFVDAQMIGHRDFNPEIRARYYPGSLKAISRHATVRPAVMFALARKLVVGLALVGRREMSIDELLQAVGGLIRCKKASLTTDTRPSRIRVR